MRAVLIAALGVALAGCASAPPAPRPDNAVVAKLQGKGRFIGLTGPKTQHAPAFLGVPNTNFFLLRSWIDRTSGKAVTQVYVNDSYFGAKQNFNAAHDAAGQALRFIPVSQNEIACNNGCSYNEVFAATLPEALLRANPKGLSVTFTGKAGGPKEIKISARQIAAQLHAIAEVQRSLPKTAATAGSAAAAAPPKSAPQGPAIGPPEGAAASAPAAAKP